jgi:lipoprotein NlpD
MSRLSISVLFGLLTIAGCASHAPVPVSERAPVIKEPPLRTASSGTPVSASAADGPTYTVKKGDTLYAIALDHGQDYKDVAAWNNLENPNKINAGQQLRMSPPGSGEGAPVAVVKPIAGPAAVEIKPVDSRPVAAKPSGEANTDTLKRGPKGGKEPYSEEALARAREQQPVKLAEPAPVVEPKPAPAVAPPAPAVAAGAIDWAWPAEGSVLAPFSEGSNKGVDIAGKMGDPVMATAAGKVVYAGSGLRGYGKLVIVRHDAEFLSAYAHNSNILVKEGQAITRGQRIADIGNTDAESPRLHFEIRRQGKPVDPMKYLPAR